MKVKVTMTFEVDPSTYPLPEGVSRTAANVREQVKLDAIYAYRCGAEMDENEAEGRAITGWSWS